MTLPDSGSKIDWSRVPGAIGRVEEVAALPVEQFTAFFDEIVQKFCLAGDVVYVGGNVTDSALMGSLQCVREVIHQLLPVPQHHYLIGPQFSWCLSFKMEDAVGFGFRPTLVKIR